MSGRSIARRESMDTFSAGAVLLFFMILVEAIKPWFTKSRGRAGFAVILWPFLILLGIALWLYLMSLAFPLD